MHNKELIFKLSHIAKVWKEVLAPLMMAQSAYNVKTDSHVHFVLLTEVSTYVKGLLSVYMYTVT